MGYPQEYAYTNLAHQYDNKVSKNWLHLTIHGVYWTIPHLHYHHNIELSPHHHKSQTFVRSIMAKINTEIQTSISQLCVYFSQIIRTYGVYFYSPNKRAQEYKHQEKECRLTLKLMTLPRIRYYINSCYNHSA